MSLRIGEIFERYTIEGLIGEGGMGTVYRARDPKLARLVALKVLRPRPRILDDTFAPTNDDVRTQARRLLREARAAAALGHPNAVAIFDVGEADDGTPFIAMELVVGQSLRSCIGDASVPMAERIRVLADVARALQAAHERDLVHLDVKPENVMVRDDGVVKVLDFGIARVGQDASGGAPSSRRREPGGGDGTNASGISGTPRYMAPEQIRGEGVDARSDQFSWGVVAYELLTGRAPWGGKTATLSLVWTIQTEQPPPPRSLERTIPERVERAVVRAMSKSPGERFASMSDVVAELDRPKRRWAAIAAVAAVAAIGAGAAAWHAAAPKPCAGAADALAFAWGPTRSADVARAFAASGSPRATEAFEHVRAVVDRYAASWTGMHTEACEATRVRGDQSDEALDLRMRCLRQRAKELAASVDLLSRADAKTVDEAVEAVARLEPVESCADVETLRAPFALVSDPARQRVVDGLRLELAEIDALQRLNRHDESLPKTQALLVEANRAGFAPLHAEALFRYANDLYETEAREQAERTYFDAAVEAESARSDDLAGRAWSRTAYADVMLGRLADADRALRLADAAVAREKGNDRLRGDVLYARAFVAYRRGDGKAMRELAEQTIALRERTLGSDDYQTFMARQMLADALWDVGDVEACLPLYEAIHRGLVDLLGPTASDSLRSVTDLAGVAEELGDYGKAVAMLEEGLASAGVSAPHWNGWLRAFLAQALVGAGRVDEGLAQFEQAKAAMTHVADSPDMWSIEADFSRFLVQRGVDDVAEKVAEQALAGMPADWRDQERGEALGARALCRARRGDAAGAITAADAALALKGKLLGERADIIPLLARGLARLTLHAAADARPDLEASAKIGDAHPGDRVLRAEVHFALARALVESGGDAQRARALAESAGSDLTAAGAVDRAAVVAKWLVSTTASRH
jgi:tetratricopeptide (TPR) repeat protein